MRPTLVARLVAALAALAVAVALVGLERDRQTCEQATDRAYKDARAPREVLAPDIERIASDCAGSEPLMGVSLGLLALGRRDLAGTLARTAADREPDSYLAWAVLQHTAPRGARSDAAARARALNPLASRAAGP
jgi:hypothetical protein